MSSNYGYDANGWEREPFPARDEHRERGAMNRGPREAANAAATSANDALVARAAKCPECGRMLALGHYALCPEDTVPEQDRGESVRAVGRMGLSGNLHVDDRPTDEADV